mmetsp:Transcript_91683/g.258862  ORF Transcript_91683/g.258862 Transcript_91683/m.258862 type:complete len:143 (+) Transcript_91683:94-522(+)
MAEHSYTTTEAKAADVSERMMVTQEELAKHNSEKDCWISLKNLVLSLPQDVLDEHPGGGDVITVLAGRDATAEFEDIGHSDTAREWANKYIIGYMEGADEETKTMKAHPVAAASTGPSGVMLPAIVMVVLAVVAFFRFGRQS